MKKIFALFLTVFLLAGCLHPYVPDVEQGNVLTEEEVGQLHTGMPKEQVQYILGEPILADDWNDDRWDYVYTIKHGQKPIQEKRLTLYFKNDALYQISKSDPQLNKSNQTH